MTVVSVLTLTVSQPAFTALTTKQPLAMDISIPISKKKAYTEMAFNSPTSGMINRFPGAYSVPKIDELIIAAGGVPINNGGNIMGGIGVSGAPSGITDEACAAAGLAAVCDDLEIQ